MTRQETLLRVEDLKTWYQLRKWGLFHAGYVKAVDGVSFTLNHREAITIVGESGSGKTTLAKTLLGLVRPTSGVIDLAGHKLDGQHIGRLASVVKPAERVRRRSQIAREEWLRLNVGFIQQDPYGALAPFMNVRRILSEPLLINGIPKEEFNKRILAVMEEVRLTPPDDFLHKYPHMLSGGQQQRLVIARSIILEPKLLLADEPVSMLDASVRVEILRLMRRVQEAHDVGVVYITHDLSTVRYFSEYVFVMYAAKLVEKARVDELIHNPKHPYTQALLTAISDPDPDNASIIKEVPKGEPPSLANPPTGCRFHPRCKHFMADLCDVEEPAEFEPIPDHEVECWLYR